MEKIKHFDAIILGAGASGFMAAIEVGKAGLSVLVIDHAKTIGRKLLVSGGGKCNVTNQQISWQDYFGEDPKFSQMCLKAFRTANTLQLLKEADIDIEEREHGRVFCKQGASALVQFLEQKARHYNVRFLLETAIQGAVRDDSGFLTETAEANYHATSLIVATGGLAWPQIGATDIGHKIAKQFKHKIIPARPALVGLTLGADSLLRNLQGISVDVEACIDEKFCVAEPLLFTHKGLSGPAIFQLSCAWKKDDVLTINFLPEQNAEEVMHVPKNGKLSPKILFANYLPLRLVHAILPPELTVRKVAVLTRKERQQISRCIHQFKEIPTGTENFMKAETTRGGVSTAQLNPKTMESLLMPNLFFAGEVVDIAGKLGGYNIHWAFASGFVAGRAVAKRKE